MKRFGDTPQDWYETRVQIGAFEIKTEEITVEWGISDCATCYKYETEMYVLENTGDDWIAGLFVERLVVMARWSLTGEGDVCDEVE